MPDAPVIVHDGSLHIESAEPVDLDTKTLLECDPKHRPVRPYKYKGRFEGKHIRRVIVRQGEKVLLDEPFEPKECLIEIYWEPRDPYEGGGAKGF